MGQGQETHSAGKEFVGPVTVTGDLVVTGDATVGGVESVTGITAFATGGQANAVALTGRYNNVTTCATAGDSVKLEAATLGGLQTVKNSGAAILAVFPLTGDSINALAVNLSVDVPPGGEVAFFGISATVWETRESLYLPAPTTQTGGFEVKATDSGGNFTGTLTNASLGQATAWSLPDPGGATANVVLDAGARTIGDVATFSAAPVFQAGPVLPFLTGANNGAVAGNVTAQEFGDGHNHVTVLTLTAAELTPTVPADAEGIGAIIYNFPAGCVYAIHAADFDITAGVMDAATNAANIALGSVLAVGDVATLTTATWQDIVAEQTIADVSTCVKEKAAIPTAGASLVFETGDSHALHINMAGTWNATVGTASLTGTVTVYWTYLRA